MRFDIKAIWPVVAALFVGVGGASSFFVTRAEADCKASLGAAEVRAELVAEALSACEAALDAVAPRTGGAGLDAAAGAGLLGGCVASAQEPPVACPPGCVAALTAEQHAAIDAARAAVQAAQPR